MEVALFRWNIVSSLAMLVPVWLLYRLTGMALTPAELQEGVVTVVGYSAVVWVPQVVTVVVGVVWFRMRARFSLLVLPTVLMLAYAGVFQA